MNPKDTIKANSRNPRTVDKIIRKIIRKNKNTNNVKTNKKKIVFLPASIFHASTPAPALTWPLNDLAQLANQQTDFLFYTSFHPI